MARREDIGQELNGISKLVADVPHLTPYGLPAGFFDNFPEQMLTLVRHLEGEGSEEMLPFPLQGLRDLATLQAPAGYFEQFPQHLLNILHEQHEEQEPTFGLEIRQQPTFRVPTGYFDHLAEQMLAKVQEEESVVDELQRLSPFLSALPRAYPGTVPAGYFEGLDALPAGIELPTVGGLEPGEIPDEAPIVQMQPRRRKSVHPFLAAAVSIGVVLLSAVWGYHIALRPFPRTGINLKTPAQLNTALANVSDQAILDYLKSSSDVSEADLMASEVDDQLSTKPDDLPDGATSPEAQNSQE